MIYQTIIILLWVLVAIYWALLSFQNKESTKSESSFSRILYLTLMVMSFYFLFPKSRPIVGLNSSFYSNLLFYYLGFVVAVAGLVFAVYSRYGLGKNWSGRIEIKENHKLITNGAYSLTRNPIYTGLLFGVIGTALMYNQLKGILTSVLIFCAFSIKIKKEEKFLLKRFPEYKSYMKKVKKLIPYVY
jgi:protein-S-isoprenylcysteine O-methyltransferase Ste14